MPIRLLLVLVDLMRWQGHLSILWLKLVRRPGLKSIMLTYTDEGLVQVNPSGGELGAIEVQVCNMQGKTGVLENG